MKPVLFAAVLLLAGCSGSAPERPNVLFIAVDDLRPELGAYGAPIVQSPSIDRLAEEGFVFTRAFVQQAVCNSSRASVMTGLRPDAIRVWDLATDFRATTPDAVTLPQYLQRFGYHTAAIGKIYHNVLPDSLSWSEPKMVVPGFPFDPDAVYASPENLAVQEARKQQILAAGTQDRFIDQFGEWYLKASSAEAPDVPDDAYYDGAQTDVAIAKLAELKARPEPFFFAVGFYRPHLPFNAPKKYWDQYDPKSIPLAANPRVPENAPGMAINNMRELRGYSDFRGVAHPSVGPLSDDASRTLKHGYYASVSYIDAQVGRLLETLEELDLADNTVVVLWGDHGWKLGEHASWGKMTNFEIDTHAPWIIRAPWVASGRTDRLVEFVDIYPTITELLDLPPATGLEGTSAVPLMREPERPWKSAVFSQFLREGIWVAPDGLEYMGYSIRTDRYRYVSWINWETRVGAARELYDHRTDPDENMNRADDPDHAERVDSLDLLLQAGWQEARPAGFRGHN